MLTSQQKQNIINNIQQIVEDVNSDVYKNLIDHIYNNRISINDIVKSDRLSRQKINRIESDVVKIREAAREKENRLAREEGAWQSAISSNSIQKLKDYLRNYPDGQYVENARERISSLEETIRLQRQSERLDFLNDLKKNPLEYSPAQVERRINEGLVNPYDIVNHLGIDREQLDLYLNPPSFFMDQNNWVNLPELPEDATDVYFLGIPGSGKSCILSALFYQAAEERKIKVDTHNDIGYRYFSELKRAAKIGITPLSTTRETVNYVSCLLRNTRNNDTISTHPLNIIEMSGEYFNETYESTPENGIGASGYLRNNNHKVLFLVFDYYKHKTTGRYDASEQQADMMDNVLQKLQRDGTLDNTDLIYIILSKADMMDCSPEDRTDYGLQFMEDNYGNFMDNLEQLLEEFNINSVHKNHVLLQPFSLGDFYFRRVYNFDGADASLLIQNLIRQTRPTKKGSFFDNLFNN